MADQIKGTSSGATSTRPSGQGQVTQGTPPSPRPPQYSGSSQTGSGMGTSAVGQSSGSGSSGGSASGSQGIADKAQSAARDLKSTATDLAGTSVDAIKGQAAGLVDAAKSAAAQAGDRLQQEVDSRKSAGAEYVGNLANTLRRAAREFESDLPIAATYIRKAASQVEGVSETIQSGNINDLVQGVQSFARRQPTAFLGLAVLAGFGAIRFLKSSAGSNDGAGEFSSQNTSGRSGGSSSAATMNRYASTNDNRGYRDEFTK